MFSCIGISTGSSLDHISVLGGLSNDSSVLSVSSFDLCGMHQHPLENTRVECSDVIYGNTVVLTTTADLPTSMALCEVEVYATISMYAKITV